jgi:uncharacterized protein
MASYKTPGVYIEEIVKFPPSVAQVETAIPAFMGFTQIAKRKAAGDLHLKPTRITSMLEYESYFGYAKSETAITVTVTGSDVLATGPGANRSPYLMYYSMQMYFANGGGPCYIVSVGQYESSSPVVDIATLTTGLTAIRKEDEPTLLLFPDATSMDPGSHTDFYALYNAALTQCNELQDRFTIIDTFSDVEYNDGTDDFDPIEAMRNNITSEKDIAKYGAVYYPFLDTILDYQYNNADVAVTITDGTSVGEEAQALMGTISSTPLQTLLTDLVAIYPTIASATVSASKTAIRTKIESTVLYLNSLKSTADSILAIGRAESDPAVDTASNTLDAWITAKIESVQLALASRLDDLNGISNTNNAGNKTLLEDLLGAPLPAATFYSAFGLDPLSIPTATILVDINTAVATAGSIDGLVQALLALTPGGSSVTDLEAIKASDNLLYNKIKTEIGQLPVKLPPSSAMAGIYARIDKSKGVWKAPANVNVSYVIKPTVQVSHEDQADLNVTTTGKSINAIRSFTGKGILVWGSRTLAGNDNEWRYVPVRRFFNMVEESVKKATEQFVFEGNDANTWVRLRAMIENFLVLQWRAGALTGAKPEQAFFVRVGLGQTMTADDILNGYMNVEIGMAVVRPAEFIVLKFSHKMQEA